jgi:hypothetical protein
MLTSAGLLLLGLGLLAVGYRWDRGDTVTRRIWVLMAAALIVRTVFAWALWGLASAQAPDDPLSLVTRWTMSSDAMAYQGRAAKLAHYWVTGDGLAQINKMLEGIQLTALEIFMGAFYSLLGTNPLPVVQATALFYVGACFLFWRLCRRLGRNDRDCFWIMVVLCFWPPSLVFGLTPLKEGMNWLFLAGTLWAIVGVVVPADGSTEVKWRQVVLSALSLFVFLFLMTKVRWYVSLVLIYAFALAAVISLTVRLFGRRIRWRQPALIVLAFVLMIVAYAAAETLNFNDLVQHKRVRIISLNGIRGGIPTPTAIVAKVKRHRADYRTVGGSSVRVRAASDNNAPAAIQILDVGGGLLKFYLFPYPWETWPKSKHHTLLSWLIRMQSLFWYVLLVGIAWGVIRSLREFSLKRLMILAFIAVFGLVAGYVVINLGTLYRIRDPILVVAVLFCDFTCFRRLGHLIRRVPGAVKLPWLRGPEPLDLQGGRGEQ